MLTSTKPPKCKHCRQRTESVGRLLHESCVEPWLVAERARKAVIKLKVERELNRQRRLAIKPRAKWLAECQAIVNAIVRLRDRELGCVSCDRPATWDGQWHASHFRSVGAASSVRFHMWNIHRACSICNNHKSGNLEGYRPRIVERIGQEKVDWLLSQNQLANYRIPYLTRFKKVMGKRLRRLLQREEKTKPDSANCRASNHTNEKD